MTIDQAKKLRTLVDSYESYERMPSKLKSLHRDGNIDELYNIACNQAIIMQIEIQNQIGNFDTQKTDR